jgi:rhodanese-related sulfurtransferase
MYPPYIPDNTNNDISKISTVTASQLKEDFSVPLTDTQNNLVSKAWGGEKFMIIDVRSVPDYTEWHIKGAINSPANFVSQGIYGADSSLVVYSPHNSETDTAKAALAKQGVKNIYVLNASLEELKAEGYIISQP